MSIKSTSGYSLSFINKRIDWLGNRRRLFNDYRGLDKFPKHLQEELEFMLKERQSCYLMP